MREITKEHNRLVWRKANILFGCMIARFLSYVAAFVYVWQVRGGVRVLGIWCMATYLSRFLADAIVDRIYGRTPGEDRSYFGLRELTAAVITTVFLIGFVAGLW
jgi:hypothetical protein